MKLDIISIFKSIDGEVNAFYQGMTTVFIRFAKCNCRCTYCDTAYSFVSGTLLDIDEVITGVRIYKTKKVTITGGEPLLQLEGFSELVRALLALNYKISVETNGSIAIPSEFLNNENISWVVDYKLASSAMMKKMTNSAFADLTEKDFVKFVISDKDDFDTALTVRSNLRSNYNCKAHFAFAPLHGSMDPKSLYELIEAFGDGSEIVNIQLHKYIWPNCGVAEER